MASRYNTLLELLEHAFSNYTDQPAFTCLGHTLSFSEVDELSKRFASYLQHDLGMSPGDRIALQMPNILQYPIAMYGAMRAGMVIINTNPLYTGRELKHQLKDSGAITLVVLSNVANVAADILEETDVKHVIVTDIADLHPTPKRQVINFAVRYLKKMVPPYTFRHGLAFRDAVAKPAQALKPFQSNSDSLFALQYTGGTTGVAKGAMLSHGNLAANVWQMVSHMPEAFKESQETFICCLPLYHIYAFNLHGLCAFSYGEHNILIPNPRDLISMVNALKKVKMTVFVGINTLYVALCRDESFRQQVDFSHLQISSAGGMAMTVDASLAWQALTGCEVCEGYGLTETSPVICGNKIGSIRLGTVGPPMIDTEIRLLGDDGEVVAEGEAGELCVRGPQVMKAYWNRPDETAKVLSDDGWFCTGDMAVRLDDGAYKLVDRKKDMIIVSGFNVYPTEVEDVVSQHPGVVEAAVVGISDSQCGETVKLFVVPAHKDVTEDEIRAHCRENLTGYKRPKIIEFRDSLPKSNVGKILRRELRDQS